MLDRKYRILSCVDCNTDGNQAADVVVMPVAQRQDRMVAGAAIPSALSATQKEDSAADVAAVSAVLSAARQEEWAGGMVVLEYGNYVGCNHN
jgi:hypothetical protein